jgi:hypothetical protein
MTQGYTTDIGPPATQKAEVLTLLIEGGLSQPTDHQPGRISLLQDISCPSRTIEDVSNEPDSPAPTPTAVRTSPPTAAPDHFDQIPVDIERCGELTAQLGNLNKATLVAYLDAGAVVTAGRMLVPDAVDPSGPSIPLLFLTDGDWLWTAEAAAYITRYDMAVPEEFLQLVESRDGVFPEGTEQLTQDIARATEALIG